MFNPESLWGKAIAMSRNRKCPEATMMKSCSDISAAQRAVATHPHTVDQCFSLPFVTGIDWSTEEKVLDTNLAATDSGCVGVGWRRPRYAEPEQQRRIHEMLMMYYYNVEETPRVWWDTYCEALAFCTNAAQRPGTSISRSFTGSHVINFNTTSDYLQHLTDLYPSWASCLDSLTETDLACTKFWDPTQWMEFEAVQIGSSFKLKRDQWFLARPSKVGDGGMWFGKAQDILQITIPGKNIIVVEVGFCSCLCLYNKVSHW
jgi:hypothetical protein